MARVLAAVVVLGACGGACGGDAAVPAPCRAPLVATLDDAPLAFDHVFGYRKGEATGVAWFAGEVLGDGQARPRPPSCAEAARGGVGAAASQGRWPSIAVFRPAAPTCGRSYEAMTSPGCASRRMTAAPTPPRAQ